MLLTECYLLSVSLLREVIMEGEIREAQATKRSSEVSRYHGSHCMAGGEIRSN